MFPHQKKGPRSKALKQDDSIMGTNSSSIVSKRSVERLYFANEPHFFRYFVKKPQRRAPLINRGYWLRMKAIDFVVHQFLEEASEKPKIVVNLGCGYDPLPWQCLTRYPDLCKNVKFVDVDYEGLMLKKREIVDCTVELSGMLTSISSGKVPILLTSKEYVQVGCDLRDLSKLSAALASVFRFEECLVLFSAEVSVTYMDLTAANALIKWAGSLPNTRFCLLEQILPEGIHHPFAKTMLAHFDKLQTPLRSVHEYPTVADQEDRFGSAGWENVRAVNLWQLWAASDLDFLDVSQRMSLDEIEPFDEWEEFALFGCHYSLLVAENGIPSGSSLLKYRSKLRTANLLRSISASSTFTEYGKQNGYRRFAVSLPLRSSSRQQDLLGNSAGMGLNSRLNSCDVYTPSDSLYHREHPSEGPSNRMCHTATDLADVGTLVVGGRRSPDYALADCWLFHKWTNTWERVDDLPAPRYRHAAVSLGNGRVLVVGGKTSSAKVMSDLLTWDRRNGWTTVQVLVGKGGASLLPSPRFGAILCCITQSQEPIPEKTLGLLAGGMSQDGVVLQDCWAWTLDQQVQESFINFDLLPIEQHTSTERPTLGLARFGAAAVKYRDSLIVVGGIGHSSLLPEDQELICVELPSKKTCIQEHFTKLVPTKFASQRSLLCGISISICGNVLVIMGGGATCFSFGTYWNKGSYTISLGELSEVDNPLKENQHPPESWKYLETIEMTKTPAMLPLHVTLSSTGDTSKTIEILRRKVTSRAEFDSIVSAARPVILEGVDTGVCTNAWTPKYLKNHIGCSKQVIVHKAAEEQMDFVSKNFEYAQMQFGDFMDAIDDGHRLYLRSTSAERPTEVPADITSDFPTIAADFQLPPELDLVKETVHSSPLRISGPVNMWCHYDVMANVLCQIRGSKRVLLFPPSDVHYLEFSEGASSSSINVFRLLDDGKLGRTSPHEAILNPGDVLFLPALWLHAASPIERMSVAVNMFFKSFDHGYAPGKDVYGNRDLQAYEKGRQDVARISKSFDSLPGVARQFYMQRLAEELRQSAERQR